MGNLINGRPIGCNTGPDRRGCSGIPPYPITHQKFCPLDKPLYDLSLAFSDALFSVDLFLLVFVGKETRLGTIDQSDNVSDLRPCNVGINFGDFQ